MANNDFPRGFEPVRHLCGGEIRTNTYILTTGQTVYKGDVLKVVAAGTVQAAAANDGPICIGVAAHYADDSDSAGGVKVAVWDDPNIVFEVQSTTGQTPAATEVFASANHVAGSGDASSQLSGHELGAISAAAAQFKVLGLADRPDNAWGEHADLEVVFDEHFLKYASTGV